MSVSPMPLIQENKQEMDTKTFGKLRSLIYDKCGITLRDTKRTMLGARIRQRLRILKYDSYEKYLDFLVHEAGDEEWVQLINVVSTNVTAFYREVHHFDQLGVAVKKWASSGQGKMRFWSAASSSGQEPYTMAMVICNALRTAGRSDVDARILATDISTKMLAVCQAGQYNLDAIEPVPNEDQRRYFYHDKASEMYQVTPAIRQMVHFARMNLSETPYAMNGPMDAIFCRNVMIYFDNHVRSKIVEQVLRLLKPGGLFMIGHAESLQGAQAKYFDRVGASMYLKKK